MLGTVIISFFSVAYWISVHISDILFPFFFQCFSTAPIVSSYINVHVAVVIKLKSTDII